MTQKLNVSSAVEFRQIRFSVSEFASQRGRAKKKSKKMVQRLGMFLATGKLAFLAYFLLIFSTRVSRKTWSSARPLLIKNANFPVARNILSLCTFSCFFFCPTSNSETLKKNLSNSTALETLSFCVIFGLFSAYFFALPLFWQINPAGRVRPTT